MASTFMLRKVITLDWNPKTVSEREFGVLRFWVPWCLVKNILMKLRVPPFMSSIMMALACASRELVAYGVKLSITVFEL